MNAAGEAAPRGDGAQAAHGGGGSAAEALFLLVFGSRPGIKAALPRRLSSPDGDAGPAR